MNTNPIHPSARHCNARRSLKALALTTLTVAGLGLALAGPAAAVCENVAPNASLILGPAKHSVTSSSNGGGYANVGCLHWVVDISVPSNSSGTGNDLKSFTIWTNFQQSFYAAQGVTQANCANVWDRTYLYKKPGGGGAFQLVGSLERRGKWITGQGVLFPCTLIKISGDDPLTKPLAPPANGTDLYRVVTSRRDVNNQFATVYVEAVHLKPDPVF